MGISVSFYTKSKFNKILVLYRNYNQCACWLAEANNKLLIRTGDSKLKHCYFKKKKKPDAGPLLCGTVGQATACNAVGCLTSNPAPFNLPEKAVENGPSVWAYQPHGRHR